ncbi:hypothetical protein CKO27_23805, partial [Thiocystis violacea]|nr:hypothetical protein [Thiocystis violacea]
PAAPGPAEGRRGLDGDIDRRFEEQAAEIARLAADLRQHRDTFQGIEVSLVTRIADVDDDRRQAATRLQRSLQTQREDLDDRLRRQTSLMLLVLLLFGLAIAGTLTFLLVKLEATQDRLAVTRDALEATQGSLHSAQTSFTNQINEVKGAFERIEIPEIPDQDPLAREKINQLSRAVAEITESLERLGNEATPPPVEPGGEPPSANGASAAPTEPPTPIAIPIAIPPRTAAPAVETSDPPATESAPPSDPETAPPAETESVREGESEPDKPVP